MFKVIKTFECIQFILILHTEFKREGKKMHTGQIRSTSNVLHFIVSKYIHHIDAVMCFLLIKGPSEQYFGQVLFHLIQWFLRLQAHLVIHAHSLCSIKCSFMQKKTTILLFYTYMSLWGCRGSDRMVVGFTTTYAISAYNY